jgi:hypothetical protein
MYSDGSVKNMMKDGTYAWMVAKTVTFFVRSSGDHTVSCFHPGCELSIAGSLPIELAKKLFEHKGLNFGTHTQAAILFKNHCLRERAVCLQTNGVGTYLYDETMGLWAELRSAT